MKMDDTDRALQALKEQMTDEQRNDMAELLKNELIRREKEKMKKSPPKHKSGVKSSAISGGLDASSVGEMYGDLDKNVRELRLRKLERELEEAKLQQERLGTKAARPARARRAAGPSMLRGAGAARLMTAAAPSPRNLLLLLGIVGLAGMKVLFSTGVVNASSPNLQQPRAMLARGDAAALLNEEVEVKGTVQAAQPDAQAMESRALDRRVVGWSESEKRVLSELDARRVELEKRKSNLDQREAEIEKQGRIVAERLAELRTLTTKLAEIRKEKDQRYEARLEQLANVYSSMAPNDAAPLIGRLDEEIALALLERMPEKRMGQILGMMGADRAVELTRVLTSRTKRK